MKKIGAFLCICMFLVTAFSWFGTRTMAETAKHDNVLIAYFSRAGENYSVGTVEKGNTEILAETIAEETGGSLFQIRTVQTYPEDYMEMVTFAREEQAQNARPELATEIENLDQYDVIFLGYPIWCADLPMAMYTFLESYDFSGKTIIPFNTHEGSGQAGTATTIRNQLTQATVLDSFAVRGSTAQNDADATREAVQEWMQENDFDSLIATEPAVYTQQDIQNLQNFLLNNPTAEDLSEKAYDLDGDNMWSAFDLSLMRQVCDTGADTTEPTELHFDFPNVEITGIDMSSLNQEQLSVLHQQARYCQAMTDADIATMCEIVSEDSTFTHMSGVQQTREEYFADVADGSLRYYTIGMENPVVTVDGDMASVKFTSVLDANAYGATGVYHITGTHFYEKRNGEWISVNQPNR